RDEESALDDRRHELETLAREITDGQAALAMARADFAEQSAHTTAAAAQLQADREALAALEADMQQRESDLLAEQSRWGYDRQEQQSALEQELQQRQDQAFADLQKLREEHQRLEVDLSKRTHFHEAHLGRLREEIEQEHRQGRVDQQQLAARQID